MHGDPSHANAGEPLPPVRTRWGSSEPKSGRGGKPVAPVRSGLFGPTSAPAADDMDMDVLHTDGAHKYFVDVESEEPDATFEADVETVEDIEEEPTAETVLGLYVEVIEEEWTEDEWPEVAEPERPMPFRTLEPPAEPWAMGPDVSWDTGDESEGDDELLLDVSLEDVIEEAVLDAAGRDVDEDTAPAEPIAESAEALTEFLDAAEAVRAHPAPLSPWQVGRAAGEAGDDTRSARRGHEWEAFGKALADTLGAAAAAAAAFEMDDDLDDATGFDDVIEESAIESSVEGLEPIGAGLERDNPIEVTAAGSPEVLEELAERLERFAAGIRTEGHYAISRAQLSGDRMDAMLAGFAAGWLAAHEQ